MKSGCRFSSPIICATHSITDRSDNRDASPRLRPLTSPVHLGPRGAGSGLPSSGTGTFDDHDAFGATWPAVGYYNSQTDKLNTFQIILVNRSDVGAGDFDIVLNYDQIQWETGGASGGHDGLGGTSAAVGFSAGTGQPGTFFQFQGSPVNGSLIDGGPDSLVANANDGVLGQSLFSVRNGQVIPGTPEPST